MLPTFGLLLTCQLIGEVVARRLALPVPGPVLGLALLLLALRVRPALAETLRSTIGVILANLSLMFVPAGASSSSGPNFLAASDNRKIFA
jgi:putative effector of murein hydrolase LrgA (UPF0299 family)